MPVTNDTTQQTIPTFTITVNGTAPSWWYCSQGRHCQSGMAFAINPTTVKTLAGYQANCANATANLTPGQSAAVVSPSPSGVAGVATASAAGTEAAIPTVVTLPTAGSTNLPINSMASSIVSRTAGWVVLALAGCLSLGMLL
jgi:hypothetical protein